MNFTEIARRLGISRQAVQQHYHRALYKLSKIPEVRERAADLGITVSDMLIAKAHPTVMAAKNRHKKTSL